MQSKRPFASCLCPLAALRHCAACCLAISPYGGHFLRPQNNDEMQLQRETEATATGHSALWMRHCGWCDFAHIYHNFTRSPRRAVTTRTHSVRLGLGWAEHKKYKFKCSSAGAAGRGAWKLHFAFFTSKRHLWQASERIKGLGTQ